MQFLPLFLKTQDLNVTIVGGSDKAASILRTLLKTEVKITLIAKELCQDIQRCIPAENLTVENRCASIHDIDGQQIVYLEINEETVIQPLIDKALDLNILLHVIDFPEQSNFIVPVVVDRDKLVVAISSSDIAPTLATQIRGKIETLLPLSLMPLLNFIAGRRVKLEQKLPLLKERNIFWERFFRFNGERFDTQTELCFDLAFNEIAYDGDLLLLEQGVNPQLLPIAAVPLLQKLDKIFTDVTFPEELDELFNPNTQRCQPVPLFSELSNLFDAGESLLVYTSAEKIALLKSHFPAAKHLTPGTL